MMNPEAWKRFREMVDGEIRLPREYLNAYVDSFDPSRVEGKGIQYPYPRSNVSISILAYPIGPGSVVMPDGEIMPGDVVDGIAEDVAHEAFLCANYYVPEHDRSTT